MNGTDKGNMDERPGRTVLITGANGGLAAGIIARLAGDGYRLVLTDQTDCTDLAASLGDRVAYHGVCELSSIEQVDGFINEALDRTEIDILINNAGYQALTPFADLTAEKLALFNRINVEAPFQFGKALSAGMSARGWGRIVNVVSGTTWQPMPNFTGYVTSKTALIGLTRVLAHELGTSGITVNAIMPALTRHARNYDVLPEETWQRIQSLQAIKRPAVPEDLAGGIAFLISDDASFMTGQTIAMDGGLLHL